MAHGAEQSPFFCHSKRPLGESSRFACTNLQLKSPGSVVWQAVCDLCDLHRLPAPEQFRDFPNLSRKVTRGQVQLVVARYNEDTSWLQQFPEFDVVVYDKGNGGGEDRLPNVGREAHTYLHHIVTHYDSLADTTVFLQGDPHFHCRSLAEKVYSVHRGTEYLPLSETLIIERADGTPMHRGLHLERMWDRLLPGTSPPYFLSHSAACFAVSRDRMLKRPLEFYQRMLSAVLEDDAGPWQAERLWAHVFRGPPESRGIVTAADEHLFEDLQFLLRSLSQTNDIRTVVYDLGLTRKQAKWVAEKPNVLLLSLPAFGEPLNRVRKMHWWQTWIKPLLIFEAPFDRVLWIDADCFVLGDLNPILDAIGNGPVLTPDFVDVETENHPRLVAALGEPRAGVQCSSRTVNAGVVGLCKTRDYPLLAAWAYGVDWIARNPAHRATVAWADQGILLWAVRHLGLSGHIRETSDWNQPSGNQPDLVTECMKRRRDLAAELRHRFPGVRIVHWLGDGKLSRQIKSQIETLMFDGPL